MASPLKSMIRLGSKDEIGLGGDRFSERKQSAWHKYDQCLLSEFPQKL
jgi:hypothetical protein